MTSTIDHDDVLIVGAGPTGLVLALWLTKLGTRVRVIDRASGPSPTSRALIVQARTLELYRQLDLTETVLARGHRIAAMNLWYSGEQKARISLGAIGAGLTPYPYIQGLSQDQHERLLAERLGELGVTVEWATELIDFAETDDSVSARIRGRDGRERTSEAAYVVGCDGSRSAVRQTMGASFPGGTYRQVFYVADIAGRGPAMNGEGHVALDEADFVVVIALDEGKHARLIGVVSDERAGRAESLTFADVSREAIEALGLTVDKVNWFSTYHVHHRVADHFRRGRAFLAGDAGHIHSPAGGQGMNTGIGDAINLAWKLAAVVHGDAPGALLDSYEEDRIPFARQLVQTTDRAFTFVTADGRIAEFLRTRVVPFVFPLGSRIDSIVEFLFRTISQTMLNYRDGPLSDGRAGKVHGGDRLPWAPTRGVDNFDSLAAIGWQVHVYGGARPELADWCAERGVPLHAFEWTKEYGAAGLARDAAYLLRPDSYVALADPSGSAEAVDRYFSTRSIRVGPRPGQSSR